MSKFKSLMIGILKLLKKVAIVSIVVTIISYIISKNVDLEFARILEYAAVVLMVIGVGSFVGGERITSRHEYAYTKFSVDGTKVTRMDFQRKLENYNFLIMMGLSGLILFFISLVIWD